MTRHSKTAFTFGPGLGARLRDAADAREAAKMVADIYNRWKVKLPPKPAAV